MPRRSVIATPYDAAVLGLDGSPIATATDPKLNQEIARYRLDFPAFATDLLWIVDKDGQLVPLRLNRPQLLLWERFLLPSLERDEPVRVVVLKARQMGFTTMIQALAYQRTSLWSRQSALVAAHRKESSNKIFRMLKRYHKHAPQDFRPSRRLSNRAELLFDSSSDDLPGLESHITTDTADNPDLGAGETLRFVHFSEAARFESASSQPMKDKMATVKQAVPQRPGTFVFLESTAQGEGYFKSFWYDDRNGYQKAFIPWLADEFYTLPNGLEESALDTNVDGTYGNERDEREVIKAALREWAPGSRAADEDWVRAESLRRLAWRRMMVDTQLERDLRLWDQEYPSTAEHAFGASSRGAFLPGVVERLRKEAEGVAPEIRSVQQPEGPGGRVLVVPDPFGSLRIYGTPDRRLRYAIGADVAEGVAEGDYSVAQVLGYSPTERRSFLAASFRQRIDPASFAGVLGYLSREFFGALVCPEINGPGLLVLDRLPPGTPVYQREVWDQLGREKTMERGWRTTAASKPYLIENLRAEFNYGHLDVHDPATLDEHGEFLILPPGPGRSRTLYQAPPGDDKHDDTVIALALALVAREYQETAKKEAAGPPAGSFDYYAAKAARAKAVAGWQTLRTI